MKNCRLTFKDGNNYVLNGIPGLSIANPNVIIFAIISIFWVLFVSLGIISLRNLKIKTVFSFDGKLALGLAASIFIGLVIFLSKDKFYKHNFCLMNKNDPICIEENNDCYDQISSNDLISGFNFGHGKIINITASMEMKNKGNGKNKPIIYYAIVALLNTSLTIGYVNFDHKMYVNWLCSIRDCSVKP